MDLRGPLTRVKKKEKTSNLIEFGVVNRCPALDKFGKAWVLDTLIQLLVI